MTNPMMDLRALLERNGDAGLPRERIGFAAERLRELEVGEKTPSGWRSVTASAGETGRRGPAASSCAPAPVPHPLSSPGARWSGR